MLHVLTLRKQYNTEFKVHKLLIKTKAAKQILKYRVDINHSHDKA